MKVSKGKPIADPSFVRTAFRLIPAKSFKEEAMMITSDNQTQLVSREEEAKQNETEQHTTQYIVSLSLSLSRQLDSVYMCGSVT